MTIHYHGTPLTPKSILHELSGRSFCVSFVANQDVRTCHDIGQSVMLDNGAFSAWKLGKKVDWDKYRAWAKDWTRFKTSWAVIPDVIEGSEEDNDKAMAGWVIDPFQSAPVWHLHESFERLDRLVSEWPRICFGSSSEYASLRTARWYDRMNRAMEVACDSDGVPRAALHMLRGMSLCESSYPFASVDSTDVARNHNRGVPAATLAARWDAQQCPGRWALSGHQMVFAAD